MHHIYLYSKKTILLAVFSVIFCHFTVAQSPDSTGKLTVFSGSVGVTNNGFSIIPTFSLHKPASIILLSFTRKRFSIDPDVRLTFDARKGSMLIWFRYRAVEGKKFSLRVGAHPAMNFQIKEIAENREINEITLMRRFIASEIVPNYQITPNWRVGMYYLQGNGLQKDGPRTTHFLTLNTNISNIKLTRDLRLTFIPSVYYLYLDGYEGQYFTATTELAHSNLPFTLQSSINKTFRSDLPGNKDFLWNITLNYHFSKKYMRVK